MFDTCHGFLFVGHGLNYAYFKQFCKILVVLSAAKRIRLLFGTLCLDNLAFLGQFTKISDSWPGCYAVLAVHPGFPLDLLYLAH